MRHRFLQTFLNLPLSASAHHRIHSINSIQSLKLPVRGGSQSSSLSAIRNITQSITNTTASSNTTTSVTKKMSSNENTYSWENPDAFTSLSHNGYSMTSDPETFAGGWLAHRHGIAEQTTPCWVQSLGPKLTRFDYANMPIGRKPRILVLYGSLRPTSFSRKLAYEFGTFSNVVE